MSSAPALSRREFLVGSALQSDLEARGFHVFGPFPTLALAQAAVGADEYDVAIIDSASLPDAPTPRIPSVVELGNWSIAALNDGKLTYLLLAPLEPYQLARLL